MKTTKVLGIDPGLDRTGWAVLSGTGARLVLDKCGLIHTSHLSTLPQRLDYIFNEVERLAAQHKPDAVAMEEMFFLKRAVTVSHTIQTRGVILLAAHRSGLPVTSYSPKRVKSLITGSGAAGKAQVQRMVQLTLGLDKKPEPDDVADAIAIAICHLKTSPLGTQIKAGASFIEKLKQEKARQIAKIKK